MAENATSSSEDPLVTALPPAMDYITYLMLLEYQLKPDNLTTLNRLLSEDDGTLARKIGWDLLRLVLPMLDKVPDAASDCLSIIARRGNPREVVVRLAEELEKLGYSSADEDEDDFDDYSDDEDDGLPTFEGEAKRIHLGEMKLDGMPETTKSEETAQAAQSKDAPVTKPLDEMLVFKALLSMLSIVQPRIKTQYPSRFLATSLPAALGAYRRMDTSVAATTAFLDCLKQLSGKQRPALPPRSSTASAPNVDVQSQATTAAPLPDPEASEEAVAGTNTPSSNEKAIIQRLLQAVLLEVLDEFMTSLKIQEVQSMSWTIRLREKHEPERLVPRRQTDTELWKTDEDLEMRDDLVSKFVALAEELQFDPVVELGKLVNPDSPPLIPLPAKAEGDEAEEEPSEYPRSPSDVPLTMTAVVLLGAAQQYIQPDDAHCASLDLISTTFRQVQPTAADFELEALKSHALLDALLSLLYTSARQTDAQSFTDMRTYDNLMWYLLRFCEQCYLPQLRDDAHHIATMLLHKSANGGQYLHVIKTILKDRLRPNQPNPPQALLINRDIKGVVCAMAIDWLKEGMMKPVTDRPEKWALAAFIGGCDNIPNAVFDTDKEFADLVFTPPPQSANFLHDRRWGRPEFLYMLPFYISVLNLCCVIFDTWTIQEDLWNRASAFQVTFYPWLEVLLPMISRPDEDFPDVKERVPELFALEDASARFSVILEKRYEGMKITNAEMAAKENESTA